MKKPAHINFRTLSVNLCEGCCCPKKHCRIEQLLRAVAELVEEDTIRRCQDDALAIMGKAHFPRHYTTGRGTL